MPFQPPGGGLNNTAEYMTSGLPWVSSSAIPSGSTWTITFPFVTNHLNVRSSGRTTSQMALGFTVNGVLGSNRFLLDSSSGFGDEFSEQLRVTTIYIRALTNNVTASVFAGLTTIKPTNFPTLTGSAPIAYDPTGSVYQNNLSYLGLG